MNYVKGLIGGPGSGGRFRCKSILELGSYNVNGAVRDLFTADEYAGAPSRYVGVDWRAGPGVDHVSMFHDIPWISEFDVLVSCNAFEHDPYWEASLIAGLRALKPGGEVILCMAGPGYPAHEIHSSPLAGHYCNIAPMALLFVLNSHGVQGVLTTFLDPADVAFHGHKFASQDA